MMAGAHFASFFVEMGALYPQQLKLARARLAFVFSIGSAPSIAWHCGALCVDRAAKFDL